MKSPQTGPNIIKEQIHEAVEAIDKAVSRTVWRTGLRVHEVVCKAHPYWQTNPYIANRSNFLYLLMQYCFGGSIITDTIPGVVKSGEFYEEAEFEPVLFEDIEIGTKDWKAEDHKGFYSASSGEVRIFMTERNLITCLKTGMNFEQAQEYLRGLSREEIQVYKGLLQENGLTLENIFYKYPIGSSDKIIDTQPELITHL